MRYMWLQGSPTLWVSHPHGQEVQLLCRVTVTLHLRARSDVEIQAADALLLEAIGPVAVAAYATLATVHTAVCFAPRYIKCHVLLYGINNLIQFGIYYMFYIVEPIAFSVFYACRRLP